ncbi:MAG: hypothetical protein IT204_21750 [Fimbriimonadaceae bacterium]|nr:hypothetical protein [Fimbriimonadaceae bacterium]
MSRPGILCCFCRHANALGADAFHCAAFPDGIPPEILIGGFDHRAPHPDDSGVRFEPNDLLLDESQPTVRKLFDIVVRNLDPVTA